MPLYQWSTTPANNASAGAIDWAEGQPPSTVNDSARQMMADVAAWFAAPEWLNYGLTPTYVSGSQFTVAGNQVATYAIGRRVRTFNTGGTLYGTITASAYTSLTTVTVAIDAGGSMDTGLSEVDVGMVSPGGSLLSSIVNVQKLTASSGTYTPSPGANSALVIGGGAGGAGGGSQATSANTVSAGSGGGSGTIGAIWIPRGSLSSQAYVCGVGGTGVAGAAGNAGGQSNFGSLLVLPGGNGGNYGIVDGGTSGSGDVAAASPALPSAPNGSGTFLFSTQGQVGAPAFNLLNPLGGNGGNSVFGSGGPGGYSGSGSPGSGYCSGGAGASRTNSQAASAGFSGANGVFLVIELA